MTADRVSVHSAATRPPSSRRKRLLYLSLFGLALLPLGELALRVFDIERFPYTNPDLYQPDAELTYVMRPGVREYSHGCWVETNQHGLRSRDWEDAQAAGKRCVMVLGHSMAFGFGLPLEASYADRLTEFTTGDLVSINLGHCAYRYFQEFTLAKRYLDAVQPVVIVVMFTGNDFDPVADVFRNPVGDSLGPQQWLRTHSVLYRFLRRNKNKLLVLIGAREETQWGHALVTAAPERIDRHFEAYEAGLRELKELSGVPLVLCASPNGVPDAEYARVRGIAERVGAVWVPLDTLWEDERDYITNHSLGWDSHPDAETHESIARTLAEAVDGVLSE